MEVDFNNHVQWVVNIFGNDIWITETHVNTWKIMAFLIILAIIARVMLKNFKDVPKGWQNVIEITVEMMDNFTVGNMGEGMRYFGAYFFTIFAFILCCNYSGLLTLRAPTADLSTTFAMAFMTFTIIHFMAIKGNGIGSYLKGYLDPMPLFLPLNVLGDLATPISLSFRLFGNLLGGTIIMGLFYQLPIWIKIGVPAALHIYFDIFSGALQTFIFVMLSQVFIKDKAGD